ncbi:unnamed protein product [Oncorhynchus mykiss]|uniref:G-protein coupled receptors family 1 profile domain-containing protein n=1 Tax=Oncorhynchus mykiss TaxID=8022 RepID=A0A060YXD0_ONCMY|nr:unnamed protein product [Oncorhynchus mykiss]
MNSSDIFCNYKEVSNFTNNSSCVNTTQSSPSFIDLATFMHIFPSIYGILCTIGVIANGLVIYAVATCKKKMVSDIYVLNLAVADMLFLLVMPFNIHQLVRDRQWVFGNFMCKAVVVVDVSNQFTTVGIVTVLCIDRYVSTSPNSTGVSLNMTKHQLGLPPLLPLCIQVEITWCRIGV